MDSKTSHHNKSTHQIDLSVVVAAFNEDMVINENLIKIVREINTRPDVKWELICVDDGSEDNTGFLMDSFAARQPNVTIIHNPRNFGQGRSLRNAFNICQGNIIVTLDADLSYQPEYIYKLMDAVKEKNSDIVLTSPYIKGGSVKNVPFLRHLLSRVGNFYLFMMTGHRISTSTSCARAYKREVLDSLILTSNGMELQLEILTKASLIGFCFSEIPASLEWSKQKNSKMKKRRVSKMSIVQTIFSYLFNGWLQRPASAFFILSWLLIIPGLYMTITVALITIKLWRQNLGYGFSQSLTVTLKELVFTYSPNIVFSVVFLLFGIQVMVFSLLMLQNKYYFTELTQMMYALRKHNLHGYRKDDD